MRGLLTPVFRGKILLPLAIVLTLSSRLAAQIPATAVEMYRSWCAVCHGEDGAGRPPARPVKSPPLDFTNCRLATAEPDADWALVIRLGGAAAGLSSEMPEFSQLSPSEVDAIVAYLRSLCRQPGWPPGNLSFRRALFTAKAFPENEVVLAPMVSHGQSTYARVRIEASYGVRLGRRGQVEVGLPAETVHWVTGRVAGVGDLTIGGKYVLYASDARRSIVTGGVETSLGTGSLQWGFGEGTTVTEPYLAAAFRWRGWTIQSDLKTLFFARKIVGEYYHRIVWDASLSRDRSFTPTAWTAGVEFNAADRAFGITPYVLKGLTRTGSLAVGAGVRIPLSNYPYTADLVRWRGYLLWDYTRPFRGRS